MAKTFSPLRYPGGKNSTYKYIKHIVELNNISTYIEPFAGGAAIALRLLINGDVKKIIINDLDKGVFSFWYSVVNNTDKLIDKIKNTDITIDEWHKQKQIQSNKNNEDLLSLGFSTLFLNRTNRSGIIKAGVIGGQKQNGNYKIDCRFNKKNIIDRINLIASFSNQIKVCNEDSIDFIENEIKHTRNSLTFFDPPYYTKGQELYTNFYTHNDHVELAKVIKDKMRNRYWILTYDIADEIKTLYRNERSIKYYLNYSIAKPKKGREFMFFSRKIQPGNINDYLKIV